MEIEAIAATRALEFARVVGINNVVMEGDSWLVHHALINDEKSLSPFGLLIEELSFFLVVLVNYFTLTQREKVTSLPMV